MSPLRLLSLLIFLFGAGSLWLYVSRTADSGETIGIFPLTDRHVKTTDDFLVMLRKSGGLLVGDEVKRKWVSTEFFSFPKASGKVQLDLLVNKRMGKVQNLVNPIFILVDENGREISQKNINGLLGAGQSVKTGLSSEAHYFIETFQPEVAKKYRLAVSLDEWLFSAMDISISIKARRNVAAIDYKQLGGRLALFGLGAILLFFTKPKPTLQPKETHEL